MTLRYSGDDYYDTAGGLMITVPTRELITIVALPRDRTPPRV